MIALVFAGVFGLKDVLAQTLDILILFAPAVAMTIAGLAANANLRRYQLRDPIRNEEFAPLAPLREQIEAGSRATLAG